jgi:hypothetical protein
VIAVGKPRNTLRQLERDHADGAPADALHRAAPAKAVHAPVDERARGVLLRLGGRPRRAAADVAHHLRHRGEPGQQASVDGVPWLQPQPLGQQVATNVV